MQWWQTSVIYQIYPRSFKDSNGDGLGDLVGVLNKLDYLEWLGIDAIWFSPLFPSPMKDFGYDVANYVDIHPDYGTLEDFDRLLEEAHKRNIRIILDLVPNHTSDEHAWFVESRSSQGNLKRDWYIWRDPAPDGGLPNNWTSYFGGPAWTLDEATGQYYMHNFDPSQPELNWRNPEVEQAIHDAVRFWLRRGVDGFRMDVIDRIIKDDQFRDNPLNPDWDGGEENFGIGQYLRVYSERRPELADYLRRLRKVFDELPEKVSIGEVAYDAPLPELVAYYGEPTADGTSGDAIHQPYNFGLILQDWNAQDIRAHVDAYDAALPDFAWPNFVLGNHDSPRIASKYGLAQARIAVMLLLTLRGTPTLYYGDELGMTNVPIPEDQILDPQGRNKSGFNRDECRTPMQWDATKNAGFSIADTTWLPVAENYETVNVEAQRDQPASMLTLYKRLLTLRRTTPALNQGIYASVDGVPEGCYAYSRRIERDEEQHYLVMLNFTDQEKALNLSPTLTEGDLVLSTHAEHRAERVDLSAFTLGADEGVIIKL